MRYSDSYLREVVPPEDPPPGQVPPPVVAELDRLSDRPSSSDGLSETYRRSVRWTYAVIEQYRLGNYIWDQFYDLNYPWQLFGGETRVLSPIQFGLFDPDFEGPGYGLIIAGPPTQFRPRPGRIGTIRFPNLYDRSFGVIARMMLTTLHAPAQPATANSACWAQDNASPSTWGFLTSGHAVTGVAQGAAVRLAGGGQPGKLEISRHPPVDAAFVSTTAPRRPKHQPLLALSTINFPAAGLPVEVVTAKRVEPRHAVAVQNSMGVFNTWYFGIQVFFDRACTAGDSGSLVRTASGDAVALWSGELRGATLNNLTNQTLGLGQHFQQALYALRVSAWL
jgi:hypothetical protein